LFDLVYEMKLPHEDSYLADTKFHEIIDSIKDLITTFDPILFNIPNQSAIIN